jgi:glutamate 5-kinase
VTGDFERGEAISIFSATGQEIARGVVNYASTETRLIMRKPSSEIEAVLGHCNEPELVHRDNLVLL